MKSIKNTSANSFQELLEALEAILNDDLEVQGKDTTSNTESSTESSTERPKAECKCESKYRGKPMIHKWSTTIEGTEIHCKARIYEDGVEWVSINGLPASVVIPELCSYLTHCLVDDLGIKSDD